jgi:hypothetical protein
VQKIAVQKHIGLKCEVRRGMNFALPIQYFERMRGLVNNFFNNL